MGASCARSRRFAGQRALAFAAGYYHMLLFGTQAFRVVATLAAQPKKPAAPPTRRTTPGAGTRQPHHPHEGVLLHTRTHAAPLSQAYLRPHPRSARLQVQEHAHQLLHGAAGGGAVEGGLELRVHAGRGGGARGGGAWVLAPWGPPPGGGGGGRRRGGNKVYAVCRWGEGPGCSSACQRQPTRGNLVERVRVGPIL